MDNIPYKEIEENPKCKGLLWREHVRKLPTKDKQITDA
jgi:hypothetical protein